jgi:hypothetical protein
LRGLFSFYRSAVLWAGVCLPVVLSVSSMLASSNTEASALEETSIDITLNSVNGVLPKSYVEVDIQITWPDSIDTLFVDGFSFAVAYDTLVLQFVTACDNGLRDDSVWFFQYIFSHLDSPEPPNMLLWLVGEDTLPAAGIEYFISGRRTITLQFETKGDSSLYGTFTNLNFYWDTCRVNLFWRNDPDTAMVALKVFDADSIEITDEDHSLPSFTGPHWGCFDPSMHDGDAVVRSVCFYSGKIEFEALTGVDENQDNQDNEDNLPATARLRQNYPNPFNPSTTIEFYLPVRTAWRIEIINLKGQVVSEFDGIGGPGSMVLPWNGQDNAGHPVSSGVYFYRLVTGEQRSSKKMLLLR